MKLKSGILELLKGQRNKCTLLKSNYFIRIRDILIILSESPLISTDILARNNVMMLDAIISSFFRELTPLHEFCDKNNKITKQFNEIMMIFKENN